MSDRLAAAACTRGYPTPGNCEEFFPPAPGRRRNRTQRDQACRWESRITKAPARTSCEGFHGFAFNTSAYRLRLRQRSNWGRLFVVAIWLTGLIKRQPLFSAGEFRGGEIR